MDRITHESSLHDYTSQIKYALSHYKSHQRTVSQYDQVVLCGLGGSGIAAAIVKSWFFNHFPLPIDRVNDYHLPAYCGKRTLVILNSYSGNTEETLSMYADAVKAGCDMLILTSGGELKQLAEENNIPLYLIESGFQPRMTIGYGMSFLFLILGELFGQDLKTELEAVIDELEEKRERHLKSADSIFEYFRNHLRRKFILVADRCFEGVAVRFSQQLNENAKLEAFVHVLPEANHNVLESYTDRLDSNFIFLYGTEHPRVAARFDFLMGELEMENNKVLPLLIPEYNIYTLYDIIYRLDWVSVMIANELDAPLMEVPKISELKLYLNDLELIEETEPESD